MKKKTLDEFYANTVQKSNETRMTKFLSLKIVSGFITIYAYLHWASN